MRAKASVLLALGLAACHAPERWAWPTAAQLAPAATGILYGVGDTVDGVAKIEAAMVLDATTLDGPFEPLSIDADAIDHWELWLYGCPPENLKLDPLAEFPLRGGQAPRPGRLLSAETYGAWETSDLDLQRLRPFPSDVRLSPCLELGEGMLHELDGADGSRPYFVRVLGDRQLLVGVEGGGVQRIEYDGWPARPIRARKFPMRETLTAWVDPRTQEAWLIGNRGELDHARFDGDEITIEPLDPAPGVIPCDADRSGANVGLTNTMKIAGGRRADGTLELLLVDNCGGVRLYQEPGGWTVVQSATVSVDLAAAIEVLRLGDDDWLLSGSIGGALPENAVVRYRNLRLGPQATIEVEPAQAGQRIQSLDRDADGVTYAGAALGAIYRRGTTSLGQIGQLPTGIEALLIVERGEPGEGPGAFLATGDVNGFFQFQLGADVTGICEGPRDRLALDGTYRVKRMLRDGDTLITAQWQSKPDQPSAVGRIGFHRLEPNLARACRNFE
jgi:hypothetical protein